MESTETEVITSCEIVQLEANCMVSIEGGGDQEATSSENSGKPMEYCDVDHSPRGEDADTIQRICLVGNVSTDETVLEAAQKFSIPVECSVDASEWIESPVDSTVFVIEEFSGPLFDNLRQIGHRVLGPTALKEMAEKNMSLLCHCRPLYCLAMYGLFVCFTGFRIKEELSRLILLIHSMGGSIRRKTDATVTHLIANSCLGDKYQYAVTFRLPIMSKEWVHNAWALRTHTGFNAAVHNVEENKLKPFHGARVCFLGFNDEETTHMSEILVENGGHPTDVEDPACTHIVVDSLGLGGAVSICNNAVQVKPEWFWTSVQRQHCVNENTYLYEDDCAPVTPISGTVSAPSSIRGGRKRKRLNASIASQSSVILSAGMGKRRSSVSDANLLSCSGSFLDSSKHDLQDTDDHDETPRKPLSARQQVFLELLQTESNYVGILSTIMHMFKAPLEELIDSDEQLLNVTELKIIFGNFPPIYQCHILMLEQFKYTAQNWREDVSIGNIYLTYAPDLEKAYPPFVNFFENTREMLTKCDESKPRFHAFLKALQTKPECGRQSLQELLIRPIQRLPSVSLLLNDLLKHTSKSNPDHAALEKALAAVKAVMAHINEDKRKTEGQMVIFNIFNNIENCPPQLISSHRSFINKCEVVEIGDSLSKKGDPLVLYLFSDMLEICKKRSKVFNALKSPNSTLNGKNGKVNQSKPFKHVELIPLSAIKRVVDITETEECCKVFALMCCSTQDLKEKLFSFAITEEEIDKMLYLKTLCRHSANMSYRVDSENILASVDAESVAIDPSAVGLGTLGKAFKLASRTRSRVGRALSFNKTPSKLKRAVSTMLSPFGSSSNLTPATQLAQMRLASCTNLAANPGAQSPTQYPQAPLSVQPTRKSKRAISITSLRRL